MAQFGDTSPMTGIPTDRIHGDLHSSKARFVDGCHVFVAETTVLTPDPDICRYLPICGNHIYY